MARRVSIKSVIGEGTKFVGTITTNETTRIDGEFKGTVQANSMLIVGETGKVDGDIVARDVVVAGEVNGNIKTKGKTDVAATGRIYGDLATRSLTIDENAVFQGACAMNVQSADDEELDLLDDV